MTAQKAKERHKVTQALYFTKFCTSVNVIVCANFSVKMTGVGCMAGQSLGFPIELVGHSYNSAAPLNSL